MADRAPLHSDMTKPPAGPRWIFGPNAQAFLFSMIAPLDAMQEWLFQGIQSRFPGLGPPEADAYVARDRKIRKGPNESRDAWAARARGWLNAWRRAGSPFAILEQLAGFFSPSPPTVYLVTASGHWYWRTPDGVEHNLAVSQRPPAVSSNWNWSASTGPEDFWIIVDCSAGPYSVGGHWGDGGKWGDGRAWGTSAVSGDIAGIRLIASTFRPAHAHLAGIILDYTAHFQPTGSGAGYPNGTWDQWANRWQPAAYCDGE